MRLDVLVVVVDLVVDQVEEHAEPALVGLGHERAERGVAAEARLDRARLHRPVAVVRAEDLVAVADLGLVGLRVGR